MKYLFFLLLSIWGVDSCNQKKVDNKILQLSKKHQVLFLNETDGSVAITKDEMEHFFDQINIVDMSIQMKKNFSTDTPREEVLSKYKKMLADEVMDFTAQEITFAKEIFTEIYEASNKVSENIFPKELKLIKIKGNHYGELTYYTRENCIIIPQVALSMKNKEAFQSVMLHELSHVYTRLNPVKKKALYQLIGFEHINPTLLRYQDTLKNIILLNPDGIDFAYQINLKDETGKSFGAIPLITANHFGYTTDKPDFFNYLNFNLYEIVPPVSKFIKVISKTNGEPIRDLTKNASFHQQIKDNTGYIIHPDEIVADNFMFLITKELTGDYPRKFSTEGLDLLKQIKEVIMN